MFRPPGVGTTIEFDELNGALVITESEGIGSNDNDTSIATCAAIIDYVANNAGGGGISASVGTGGDYADVQAAYDDGARNVHLVSDVTEDSDIAVGLNTYFVLNLNNYTLDLDNNQITVSNNAGLHVFGDNIEESRLLYSPTSSAQDCIDCPFGASEVILQNFTYEHDTSSTNCDLIDGAPVVFLQNVQFLLPNTLGCGLILENDQSVAISPLFVGGGSACDLVLIVRGGATVHSPRFTGTFESKSTSLGVVEITGGGVVTDLKTHSTLYVENGGVLQQAYADNTALNLTTIADESMYEGCDLGSGTFEDDSFDYVVATSLITSGTFDIDGNRGLYTNCRAQGGVDIAGNYNWWQGQAGANAGGGSNTITVQSGATSNILNGFVDAAISDSGTTTVDNTVTY